MIYILDSYAWIEYLLASEKGKKINKLFAAKIHKCITVDCSVAEIFDWCSRNNQNFEEIFKVIKANSYILQLLIEHWIEAAKIKFEQRKKIPDFGLIDALLIAKQKDAGATIITGDKHFKNLRNVLFLE